MDGNDTSFFKDPKVGSIEIFTEMNVSRLLAEYQSIPPTLDSYNFLTQSRPWLLINWPFIERLEEVGDVLTNLDIEVKEVFDIHGYTKAGLHLYPNTTINPADFDTWGWYAVSRLAPDDIGEAGRVLVFDETLLSEKEYSIIFAAKLAIREQLGTIKFTLNNSEGEFVTDFRSCHAPDYENIQQEFRILSCFKKKRTAESSSIKHNDLSLLLDPTARFGGV